MSRVHDGTRKGASAILVCSCSGVARGFPGRSYDDDALGEAMRLMGTTTKKDTANQALRDYVNRIRPGNPEAVRKCKVAES
ncbi:type II toxin-antitoxin system VapB family antitoxin [Nocardia sp. NBC_00881]|uniref:type II toxin-antitoxin system VapB family antitoxin n=1 Tax=Nocardia sp. NBC_00881 TaxID=2975995 RepID=UPI00386BE14C|nr:type II toxin-antitoxin system VapB family antitoxin [Nocardia sp. NBC_00881]